MPEICTHLDQLGDVGPDADGVCPDCVAIGSRWVHLRMCLVCGHVGCCDDSPNRHATAHFHATEHPLIRSLEPGEDWCWCYVDQVAFVLGRTDVAAPGVAGLLMRVDLPRDTPAPTWPDGTVGARLPHRGRAAPARPARARLPQRRRQRGAVRVVAAGARSATASSIPRRASW